MATTISKTKSARVNRLARMAALHREVFRALPRPRRMRWGSVAKYILVRGPDNTEARTDGQFIGDWEGLDEAEADLEVRYQFGPDRCPSGVLHDWCV